MSSHLPRVLVIGESIVDIVRDVRTAGGSALNVACGVALLDDHVELATMLGADEDGLFLGSHARSSGVTLVLPPASAPIRSSTALVRFDSAGDAEYLFNLEWMLPDGVDVARYDIVHIGSIAAFVEPGATTVRNLFAQARSENAITTFDPNIRATFLQHNRAIDHFEAMAQLACVVKLSDADAAWLYPNQSAKGVISRLLNIGADLVVLTKGSQGADLASRDSLVHIPSIPVAVADTVGAGDSFMAALIHWIVSHGRVPAEQVDMQEAGSQASFAAAVTVSRTGANLPTLDDITALRKRSADT